MKKIDFLLYIPLICLISCNGGSGKLSGKEGDSTRITTVSMTSAPDTTKFIKSGSAKFLFDEKIDLRTAHDMIDLYKVRRKELIDSTYKIDDTKAITFDLAKMKAFIQNVSDAGGVGVRIYLGVYPATEKYPGQTTIIAIGVNKDGKDLLQNGGTATKADGLDPYNHGNLCPPGKDCN